MQTPNIDPATGSHYGVIQANSINDEYLDDLWHGGPYSFCEWSDDDRILTDEELCKVSALRRRLRDTSGKYTRRQKRWAKDRIRAIYDGAELVEDAEPVNWYYEHEGLVLIPCFDATCFMVIKSPVVVQCRACSPCCPNAGDLDSPDPGGLDSYALPVEWLEPKLAADTQACLELMEHLEDWEHGKGPDDPDCEECLRVCARCGSPLTGDLCGDETCPFDTYQQDDHKGWTGHPQAKTIAP